MLVSAEIIRCKVAYICAGTVGVEDVEIMVV